MLNALAILSLVAWLFAFLRMATSATRQTGTLESLGCVVGSIALALAVLAS